MSKVKFEKETAELDVQPVIQLEINIQTGEAGGYSGDITAYVYQEEAGDGGEVVGDWVEVGSWRDEYEGVSVKYIHKALLTRAADYLTEKDIGGLVTITGNQADSVTRFGGTGITRYKVWNSTLFLSPYATSATAKAAKQEYISYRVEDIPARDRQLQAERTGRHIDDKPIRPIPPVKTQKAVPPKQLPRRQPRPQIPEQYVSRITLVMTERAGSVGAGAYYVKRDKQGEPEIYQTASIFGTDHMDVLCQTIEAAAKQDKLIIIRQKGLPTPLAGNVPRLTAELKRRYNKGFIVQFLYREYDRRELIELAEEALETENGKIERQ